jgi:hypothetical protein
MTKPPTARRHEWQRCFSQRRILTNQCDRSCPVFYPCTTQKLVVELESKLVELPKCSAQNRKFANVISTNQAAFSTTKLLVFSNCNFPATVSRQVNYCPLLYLTCNVSLHNLSKKGGELGSKPIRQQVAGVAKQSNRTLALPFCIEEDSPFLRRHCRQPLD